MTQGILLLNISKTWHCNFEIFTLHHANWCDTLFVWDRVLLVLYIIDEKHLGFVKMFTAKSLVARLVCWGDTLNFYAYYLSINFVQYTTKPACLSIISIEFELENFITSVVPTLCIYTYKLLTKAWGKCKTVEETSVSCKSINYYLFYNIEKNRQILYRISSNYKVRR